ncbi:MAG: NADH-quinone oxidoreductase subunit L [Calditrichia bacterium]
MSGLLLTIPLAPLFAALLIILFGRRLPFRGGELTLTGSLVSLLALILIAQREFAIETLWLHTGGFSLTLGLQVTRLSYWISLLVAAVALVVNLYSLQYMKEEQGLPRFFALMSFFIAAMLTLVLSGSLLLLFAAWEGVGLASFLLIGFWYKKDDARQGAQRAFLFTRLGDVGLLLGWLWALLLTGSTNIDVFLQQIHSGTIPAAIIPAIAVLFLAGAVGKSAQLPLSSWLSAAMAGPTPVSALIHSATMVAAGVYLILRFFPLFESAPAVLTLIFWTGGITALFSALVATGQYDLKKILAWSTSSQLGEMFFALGLAGPLAAVYHLITHAAFKSTLFLAAGAVDHATGTRRLDRLGGMAKLLPLTAIVFLGASLALAGIPPFSGFWSEDKILSAAVHQNVWSGAWMLLLIFLAGIYISRAAMAVFGNAGQKSTTKIHRPGKIISGAMLLLLFAALFIGWLLHGRIESMLPFTYGHKVVLLWKLLSVFSGIAGLAFGGWRVKAAGAVPALGSIPFFLEQGLERIVQSVGTLIFLIAGILNGIETLLDRAVRALVGFFLFASGTTSRAEGLLDKSALQAGRLTFALADGSGRLEDGGFSKKLDQFAASFSRAGKEVRRLQTGKLYLYTLGLFIWGFVFALLGLVFWF